MASGDDSLAIPQVAYGPVDAPRPVYIFAPKATEPNKRVRDRVNSSTICDITSEPVDLDKLPVVVDFIEQKWTILCPECHRNHSSTLLELNGPTRPTSTRSIDATFALDLGELSEGQHVILRGIERGQGRGSWLHNDYVPGFVKWEASAPPTWGLGEVTDDVGTVYEHQGFGGWSPDFDDLVRWGEESLGNTIPPNAKRLSISFHCSYEWEPPGPWVEQMVVNPITGEILEIRLHGATNA